MPGSKSLSVVDRGGFFDDPFFRDSWADFDTALQRVLDKFDNRGLKVNPRSRPQCRDVYRDIRTNKLSDDAYSSQAVQVTEKDGRFQAVMDVKDFNPRNLQVRAVEDNRIIVEGKYQQVTPDGTSASSKSFYKAFTLPDEADIDLVSTALSKDGVLTIKAPKKEMSSPGKPSKPAINSSQSTHETYEEKKSGTGTSMTSFKTSSSSSSSYKSSSSKNYLQSSSSFESNDSGLGSLSKDIRERLMFPDSGMSSVSSSESSCSSPAPSETASETSRVSSTMDFDTRTKSPIQRSEVTFNVQAPMASSKPSSASASQSSVQQDYRSGSNTPTFKKVSNYTPMNAAPAFMQSMNRKSVPSCGSGGSTNVTVTEKDGRRTLTSETSKMVQEKDGFMESREVASEITDKESEAARREATTKMQRKQEDPDGRYKHTDEADSSDVSESCVKRLPDGSTVSMSKNMSSSSSYQQSVCNSGDPRGFGSTGLMDVRFPEGFGNFQGFMGQSPSLMPQKSTDSMASTLSGRSSAFSDRSTFSDQSCVSDHSRFSTQSQFSEQSTFSEHQNFPQQTASNTFPDFPKFPDKPFFQNQPRFMDMPNFPDMHMDGFRGFPNMGSSTTSNTSRSSKSTFASSFSSPFDSMKF